MKPEDWRWSSYRNFAFGGIHTAGLSYRNKLRIAVRLVPEIEKAHGEKKRSPWLPSLSPPWSDATLVTVLILASALPYLNTLSGGFVYDDLTQVTKNPYIINFHHLPSIFTTGVWSFVGKQGVTNYYRPLMTLGYAFCYHLFGELAFGYHLVNLTLHVAVVCVLFGLTLSIFGRRDLAFLTALLFALHPVHTESVDWIAAVPDLEVTFFFLLTFWLFVKAANQDGGRSEWALGGMVICFALALLSKEQALMLPVVATIYEHGYREDRSSTSWRQKISRYGVLWLIAVGYLLLRMRVFGSIAPVTHAVKVTWPQAFLSAVVLTVQYVGKMLWPVTLCAFHVFHKASLLLDPRVIAGIAVLASLTASFVFLWRRARLVSFGFIWFFITLAPVLNARWMAASIFAERYLYLPSVGFCWIAAWCAVRVWEAAGKRRPSAQPTLAAGLSVLLILCAVRIFTRNRDWSNDIRLYTRTLAQQPDAWPILINLGTDYWYRGNVDAAGSDWMKAVRIRPRNAIALSDLGLFYAKKRQYPEAVAYFSRAMRLKPFYTDPHLNLGVTYRKMGLEHRAELQLRAAVALSPLDTRAHNELGDLFVSEGKYSQAEQQFRRSIEATPNEPALDSLGEIYMRWHDSGRAERTFLRALSLNPYDSEAYFGLGAIYLDSGRNAMAIREYKSGLQMDPRNQQALAALERLQRDEQQKHNAALRPRPKPRED
jgi:tetratricopeptide (TPR) repeat protein